MEEAWGFSPTRPTRVLPAFRPGPEGRMILSLIQGTEVRCSFRSVPALCGELPWSFFAFAIDFFVPSIPRFPAEWTRDRQNYGLHNSRKRTGRGTCNPSLAGRSPERRISNPSVVCRLGKAQGEQGLKVELSLEQGAPLPGSDEAGAAPAAAQPPTLAIRWFLRRRSRRPVCLSATSSDRRPDRR